jgi:antitoxin MazE
MTTTANPGLVKRLTKHGNSLALVIDRPILEMLGIDEGTTLSIRTDGHRLVITRAQDETRHAAARDAVAHVTKKYSKALKRLADR